MEVNFAPIADWLAEADGRPILPERAAVFCTNPGYPPCFGKDPQAAHFDRRAPGVLQGDGLFPAPLDRPSHGPLRFRLFALSPSRGRIAGDEHRQRRRRDADGKPPCVAAIMLGLFQDEPLLAFVQKLHRDPLRSSPPRR